MQAKCSDQRTGIAAPRVLVDYAVGFAGGLENRARLPGFTRV